MQGKMGNFEGLQDISQIHYQTAKIPWWFSELQLGRRCGRLLCRIEGDFHLAVVGELDATVKAAPHFPNDELLRKNMIRLRQHSGRISTRGQES